ncbi:MAG: translocation protein TolB [bacterium ADurb.Bin429]|nr:MAG: translocation protein TolB [bacterium ADurb.Bin429]
MYRRLLIGLMIAAAMATLVISSGCEAEPGTVARGDLSLPQAPVTYFATHGGDQEVFTMLGNGTGVTNISNHPAQDYSPTFTPDAQSIVFVSDRDGNPELYRMKADGSDVRRLTNDAGDDWYPSMSPSGQIVFTSTRDSANPQIYSMLGDGTAVRRLTFKDEVSYQSPVLDNTGTVVIYSSIQDNKPGLFTMRIFEAANPTETRLTSADDDYPAFSPDGEQIAFVRTSNNNPDLYIMKADGTGVERLTNTAANEVAPWFSPDGNNLVFVSDINGAHPFDFDVYTINLATKQVTRMTTTTDCELHPRFSAYFATP